jgi:hypothetical protein
MERFIVAIVLLSLSFSAVAQEKKKEDPFRIGEKFFKARKYGLAVLHLAEFAKISVGDPRLAAAKSMLMKSWGVYADDLIDTGSYGEGIKQYAAFVALLDTDDAIHKRAGNKLKTAFDNAVKTAKYEQALLIASAQAEDFPKDPPLADKEALVKIKIQALGVLVRTPAVEEMAFDRYVALREAGVTAEQFSELGVDPRRVATAYLNLLQTRCWYSRATGILKYLVKEGSTDTDREKYARQLQEVVLKKAEAAAEFGNFSLTAQAVAQCESVNLPLAGKQRLTRTRTLLDKWEKDGKNRPKPLKFDEPILGEGTWADSGNGYAGEGMIRVGLGGKGGGPGKILVKAGFVLEGGHIFIDQGSIEAVGTKEKPVIFRKVEIGVGLGGEFRAQNTLFEDCTFQKDGGWFGYYSSHWILADCLMVRSNFRDLNPIDYGLQVSGCFFVDCDVPRRMPRPEEANYSTIYNTYTDTWSRIEKCVFSHCRVSPSAAWMMNGCSLSQCSITGREAYKNTKDLSVSVCILPSESYTLACLKSGSDSEVDGKVKFVLLAKNPPVGKERLWPLAGDLTRLNAPAADAPKSLRITCTKKGSYGVGNTTYPSPDALSESVKKAVSEGNEIQIDPDDEATWDRVSPVLVKIAENSLPSKEPRLKISGMAVPSLSLWRPKAEELPPPIKVTCYPGATDKYEVSGVAWKITNEKELLKNLKDKITAYGPHQQDALNKMPVIISSKPDTPWGIVRKAYQAAADAGFSTRLFSPA